VSLGSEGDADSESSGNSRRSITKPTVKKPIGSGDFGKTWRTCGFCFSRRFANNRMDEGVPGHLLLPVGFFERVLPMTPPVMLDPPELRRRGFESLVASLGWVNAVRFIQQYESNTLDYTREREQILPDWDAETMLREANALRQASR